MADGKDEMMRRNIVVMNALEGFNVVIVCCSSQLQANYWQSRLEEGKGSILPATSVVLAVQEDWPGGAGNALGTLYSYQNAVALAREKFGLDINEGVRDGRLSVGLYHTAGKGTRLAPLPGAENNNKPGVKLPASIRLSDGSQAPITILESVIKQTGCYAKSRPGRLSVFWGDQVFIPTVPVEYTVTHHADILCSLGPMLSEEDWRAKGMDKYGLIAQNAAGNAAQVEKVDHATAVRLLAGLGEIVSVGASLGSFSVSSALLFALLREFSGELERKEGKLDSDPHLWMPMTLDRAAYLQLMAQKGVAEDVSGPHYERVQAMTQSFLADEGNRGLGLFGPVDVGQGVCWWDYGQLKLYQRYAIMNTERSNEADLMRLFFGYTSLVTDSVTHNTLIDDLSCVSSSELGTASEGAAGSVLASVVSGVHTKHISADHAILINVTAKRISAAPGSIIYNVVDSSEEGLVVGEGQVLAGVFAADGSQEIVKSSLSTDGGKAWETVLPGNVHSFEQIYEINADVCPLVLSSVLAHAHASTWASFTA